jgi:predicted component of type VI protein secretion system
MDFLRKLGNKSDGGRDLVHSIVDNLNHVLNSKRQFSYFLPDFGISDYNHLSSREDIAREIMFESRIKMVSIVELKESPSVFRLSFRIDCIVKGNSRSLSMVFDPRLDRYLVNSE